MEHTEQHSMRGGHDNRLKKTESLNTHKLNLSNETREANLNTTHGTRDWQTRSNQTQKYRLDARKHPQETMNDNNN